ncbi:unnamed protein product [Tenebrio molitor]|nr:unnamed protein product [Tenebrio molitor]
MLACSRSEVNLVRLAIYPSVWCADCKRSTFLTTVNLSEESLHLCIIKT